MEIISVSLIIVALACALFSGQIDMAVNGEKKVQRVIVTFSVGVVFICAIAIVAGILS